MTYIVLKDLKIRGSEQTEQVSSKQNLNKKSSLRICLILLK